MDRTPAHLLLHVLYFLTPDELNAARHANRHWYSVAGGPTCESTLQASFDRTIMPPPEVIAYVDVEIIRMDRFYPKHESTGAIHGCIQCGRPIFETAALAGFTVPCSQCDPSRKLRRAQIELLASPYFVRFHWYHASEGQMLAARIWYRWGYLRL